MNRTMATILSNVTVAISHATSFTAVVIFQQKNRPRQNQVFEARAKSGFTELFEAIVPSTNVVISEIDTKAENLQEPVTLSLFTRGIYKH